MLRRTTAVLTAALVLGALAAPAAQAKGRDGSRKGKKHDRSVAAHSKGPSSKGGKKPIGTVADFDGTTLTVTLKDGSSTTATADESTQVKLDHRGRPAAKGNPTRGSLDDLVAGNFVLRMKTEDGALEKIRIRTVAAEPAPATTCTDDADETETETEEGEVEEGGTGETETEEGEVEEGGTGETETEVEEGGTVAAQTEEDTEEGDTEEGDEADSDDANDCDEADEDDEDDEDEGTEEEEAGEEEEQEGDPVDELLPELPLS